MRKGTLFASILASAAALFGSVTSTPEPTPQQYAAIVQNGDAQVTGTKAPASAPVANVTSQILKAGAIDVPIPVYLSPTPRWAWVGRKVNGRFGYYCRRVGAA